jgi:hypothetical protein
MGATLNTQYERMEHSIRSYCVVLIRVKGSSTLAPVLSANVRSSDRLAHLAPLGLQVGEESGRG